MRIKLYALVFVGEGFFGRSVDQQTTGFFTYCALAYRLTTGKHKGRRQEWNVKTVLCVWIFGHLHVPSGSLLSLLQRTPCSVR